jgi:DNA modification methylase
MSKLYTSQTTASTVKLLQGDCLEILPTLSPDLADSIITDPPYGLSFMGKDWDHGVPGVPFWQAALHAIRPGGYLLAFGGTRTYHRLACAVEDAGWQIRDCLMWLYGTGWPKGPSCLKPSYEPVLLARKPGKVLPLGIDECKIGDEPRINQPAGNTKGTSSLKASVYGMPKDAEPRVAEGRWPANLILDEEAASFLDAQSGHLYPAGSSGAGAGTGNCYGNGWPQRPGCRPSFTDSGGASRFFYCSKASKEEKGQGNLHPTVKPLSLMLWLVKLVCPAGGVCLDPFIGSGTTGVACLHTGRRFIGIELDPTYFAIAQRRLAEAQGPLFAGTATNGSESHLPPAPSQGSLFPEGE